MDNLVTQGTGASRLNFAQKAIATGMSVILAFGLSPLGQVPAYADDPEPQQQQQQQVNSTDPNTDAQEITSLAATIPSREFNGESRLDDFKVTVSKGDETLGTTDIGTPTLFFFADAAKARAGKSTDVLEDKDVINAGDYAVRVELGGKYAEKYLIATASITQLDISNAKQGTADAVKLLTLKDIDSDSTYNGKMDFKGYAVELALASGAQKITTQSGVTIDLNADTVKGSLSMSRPSVKNPEIAQFQLKGSKNLKGSITLTVDVEPTMFAYGDALKIPALSESGGTYTLNAQKFGAVEDPLKGAKYGADGDGKGWTDLTTANGGLAVSYVGHVTKRNGKALDGEGEEYSDTAFPTEIGSYEATITGGRTYFASGSIKASFNVTDSSLGSVADAATVGDGTYNGAKGAPIDASTVKFSKTDDEGVENDVTSTIGGQFKVAKYEAWALADELTLLGAENAQSPSDAVKAAFVKKYGKLVENPQTEGKPTYDEASAAYTASMTGKVQETEADWKAVGSDIALPLSAGIYKVTFVGTGSFSGVDEAAITAKYTVGPREAKKGSGIGELTITPNAKASYGKADNAAPKVELLVKEATDKDKAVYSELAEGADQDFTVKYKDADGKVVATSTAGLKDVAPGTYSATFTFSGDLTGTLDQDAAITIGKADLSKDDTAVVTVGKENKLKFTGDPIEIKPTVKVGDKELVAGDDFEVTAVGKVSSAAVPVDNKATTVGTYEATVTFKGDYAGSKTQQFAVEQLKLDSDVVLQFKDGGAWVDAEGFSQQWPDEKAGQEFVPDETRLVLKDDENAYTDKATRINEDVYRLTFANNTSAPSNATATVASNDAAGVAATPKVFNFKLTQNSLEGATVSLDWGELKEVVYTGQAITAPTVTVSKGADLTVDKDYELKWYKSDDTPLEDATKVVDAGDYYVKALGKGTYGGSAKAKFTVAQLEVKDSDIKSEDNADGKLALNTTAADKLQYAYDYDMERAKEVEYLVDGDAGAKAVKYGETYLTEGEEYTLSGNTADSAGDKEVTISFKGNYKGDVKVAYKVKPIDVDDLYVVFDGTEDDAIALSVPYTGAKQTPGFKVYADANRTQEVTDPSFKYTTVYGDNVNVSNQRNYLSGESNGVTIAATGNYSGTGGNYLMIYPVSILAKNVSFDWEGDELGYTGKAVEPAGHLVLKNADGSEYTLVKGTDYEVGYEGDNVNVGNDVTATFIGKGNFDVAADVADEYDVPEDYYIAPGYRTETFKVAKAAQTLTASASKTSLTVGETAQITASGVGAISYAAGNGTVTVSDAGLVTAVAPGLVNVTVTAAGNNNTEAATQTIGFTVTEAVAPAPTPTVDPTPTPVPTVTDAANPITVKAKTATVKYKNVKKKKQTLKVSKVLTVKSAQGTVTYTKKSGNKKITINKTTGKVTIKKGLKKGTYKVKVAVKAAGKTVGTTNYTAKTVTKTFKVKVK